MSVGHSARTPAKHDLMRNIVGREVGAANSNGMPQIDRLVWLDLTAGDGITYDGNTWERGCSPGILAHHARKSAKPVDVTLYEIKPATYDRLLASLKEHLPTFGYRDAGDCWYSDDMKVVLRTVNGSGSDAVVDAVGKRDAVLVSNDPNAITDWAMRPTFAREVAARTPWFRSISTMGCNPAGLKRLAREERQQWFEHLGAQEMALPNHRDLLLASIEGDDAQWAYLLNDAVKWRNNLTTERMTATAFGRHGYQLAMAWFGTQRDAYETEKERLFLTRTERAI